MTSVPGFWVDWSGGGFGSTAYDDLSSYLIKAQYSRGGTPEITGAAQAGQGTFTLKNPNGLFDPDNAAGPLYAYLHDGPRVWFGVNEDGTLDNKGATVRGRFAGRITEIAPLPVPGAGSSTPTAEIVAEDALGWYSRTPVVLSQDCSPTVLTGIHQTVLVSTGEGLGSFPLSQELPAGGGTTPLVWSGVGSGHPQTPMAPAPEDDDGWAFGQGAVPQGAAGYTQIEKLVCPPGKGGLYTVGIGGMQQTVWPPFPVVPYSSTEQGGYGQTMWKTSPASIQIDVLKNGLIILSTSASSTGTVEYYWAPALSTHSTTARFAPGDTVTWQVTTTSYDPYGGAWLPNAFSPIPSAPAGVFWLTWLHN